jgi:hypothetical protein
VEAPLEPPCAEPAVAEEEVFVAVVAEEPPDDEDSPGDPDPAVEFPDVDVEVDAWPAFDDPDPVEGVPVAEVCACDDEPLDPTWPTDVEPDALVVVDAVLDELPAGDGLVVELPVVVEEPEPVVDGEDVPDPA